MAIQTDLYFISMAARLLDMHPQTLRKYERLGLVQPARTIGSMRLYSAAEIARLRLIKDLVEDAGVNLAGVQRLLAVAEGLQRLDPLLEETRRELIHNYLRLGDLATAEALVEQLLAEGHVVVLDATNLIADFRAPMENVASRGGAALLHVLVVAEDADVRARLAARGMARAEGDHSDADLGVYERMRARGFVAYAVASKVGSSIV